MPDCFLVSSQPESRHRMAGALDGDLLKRAPKESGEFARYAATVRRAEAAHFARLDEEISVQKSNTRSTHQEGVTAQLAQKTLL
jgi:hypothetical protein